MNTDTISKSARALVGQHLLYEVRVKKHEKLMNVEVVGVKDSGTTILVKGKLYSAVKFKMKPTTIKPARSFWSVSFPDKRIKS